MLVEVTLDGSLVLDPWSVDVDDDLVLGVWTLDDEDDMDVVFDVELNVLVEDDDVRRFEDDKGKPEDNVDAEYLLVLETGVAIFVLVDNLEVPELNEDNESL